MALDCLLLIADAEVLKAVKASLSVYEVQLAYVFSETASAMGQ